MVFELYCLNIFNLTGDYLLFTRKAYVESHLFGYCKMQHKCVLSPIPDKKSPKETLQSVKNIWTVAFCAYSIVRV